MFKLLDMVRMLRLRCSPGGVGSNPTFPTITHPDYKCSNTFVWSQKRKLTAYSTTLFPDYWWLESDVLTAHIEQNTLTGTYVAAWVHIACAYSALLCYHLMVLYIKSVIFNNTLAARQWYCLIMHCSVLLSFCNSQSIQPWLKFLSAWLSIVALLTKT